MNNRLFYLLVSTLLIQLSLGDAISPLYKGGCILVSKTNLYCAGGQSALINPSYQSSHYGLDLSRNYADLNTLNNAWTSLTPLAEPNSEFVMVSSAGNNGYFLNGGTGSANGIPLHYQTLLYHSGTNFWTNLVASNATNSLAQARGAVGVVVPDNFSCLNCVYIWGGVLDASIGSANTSYSGTFLVMNYLTGAWNPSLAARGNSSLGWTPRIGHAMITSFQTISIIGGQEATYNPITNTYALTNAAMSSIPQFDTYMLSWKLAIVTGDVPTPRSYHTINNIGFNAVMYGGATPGTNTPVIDSFYQATISSGTVVWTRLSVTGGPGPRFGHSAVVYNYQTLIIIGGVDSTGTVNSDVNIFSYNAKAWRDSFDTTETYSSSSTPTNGNSSTSSNNVYFSPVMTQQQSIAGGIGGGGFVVLALLGLLLYRVVEKKKSKGIVMEHSLEPITLGNEYTKIELESSSVSPDQRPLPPAPISSHQTTHYNY